MKMKFKEIKDRSHDELQKMLGETRERVRAMRAGVAASQQPKVRDIRAARRVIAQILTVLNKEKKTA